jgi:uncharacterized membrane protein
MDSKTVEKDITIIGASLLGIGAMALIEASLGYEKFQFDAYFVVCLIMILYGAIILWYSQEKVSPKE